MNDGEHSSLIPSSFVYCNNRLLHVLQTSRFRPFRDSKTLVDLPLLVPPEQVLTAFSALPEDPTESCYHSFLTANFASSSQYELDIYLHQKIPSDYSDKAPSFLFRVSQVPRKVEEFVRDLKRRWSHLCREFRHDVMSNPSLSSRTSLISLPHPFFVPGGRFRESYYWDSLWVVKGLLTCDMLLSAQNTVRNLLSLVSRFGFVPNGNRVYYLNRSQPPILTEAVRIVYDALPDETERISWLREAVPALDTEIAFFHKHRSVAAVAPDSSLVRSALSMYSSRLTSPRPESFVEDIVTANLTPHRNIEKVFRNLASAAESGWDFSTRWFTPALTMSGIRTSCMVPVCLNALLLRAERTLANFHRALETAFGTDSNTASYHAAQATALDNFAARRETDMNAFLWQGDIGAWVDLDLDGGSQTSVVSAAASMPAWAGCGRGSWTSTNAERFVRFIKESGLVGPGGLACTTQNSTEQWDFPNCWAPLVELTVDALQQVAHEFPDSDARNTARDIAFKFVLTVFRGWLNDGTIHEKYDCRSNCGKRGVGGEYSPQTGFGWTNGAVLWLMSKYVEDNRFFWDLVEPSIYLKKD